MVSRLDRNLGGWSKETSTGMNVIFKERCRLFALTPLACNRYGQPRGTFCQYGSDSESGLAADGFTGKL
jgi:hypothetical protein